MSKLISAAQGRVQMVVCESKSDVDYQWEHSILVEAVNDGITIKGRDGEVFVPEYAVDAIRGMRRPKNAEAR